MNEIYKKGQTIEAIKDFKTDCYEAYKVLKGERLEILRVDSEGDYCVNKKDGSLWESNSWLLAATLDSVQQVYSEDDDKISSIRKRQNQEFPIGSIVVATKHMTIANCGPLHIINFGDKLKILYIDDVGDYLVHKVHSHRYESNFWLHRKSAFNQIRLFYRNTEKEDDQPFPVGSIIEAIKCFETNNNGPNYAIKSGDIFKILKTDAKDDYLINKFYDPWNKNSWVFHSDMESKVKLVKYKRHAAAKKEGEEEKYPEGTIFKSLVTFYDDQPLIDIHTKPIPSGIKLKVINVDDDGSYWLQKLNDDKINWKLERKGHFENLELLFDAAKVYKKMKTVKELLDDNEKEKNCLSCLWDTTEERLTKKVGFTKGSIVEAITNFKTDNLIVKYHVAKGDRLKILKKDKNGDYLVNKINKVPWDENSWISKQGIYSKVKLIREKIIESPQTEEMSSIIESSIQENNSNIPDNPNNVKDMFGRVKNMEKDEIQKEYAISSKTSSKISSSAYTRTYYVGQNVIAKKDFHTDGVSSKREVRKGDKLKIIRIDAEGDFCVNLVNRTKWNKNSWILKEKAYRKIK